MTGSSIRTFLQQLADAGELTTVDDEVCVHDLGELITRTDRAVLFEHVRGYDFPVAANLLADRARWAAALGVEPVEVRAEIVRRSAARIPPVHVDSSPLHDVVHVGSDVDVTALPAYLQHHADGGPYLSAAMDVSRSPSTGEYNLGMRRLMVRGRDETGVDVVAPSDLRAYYRQARDLDRRFEVAFVIGGHPLDCLASQLKVGPVDDFELAGALRGGPVPLVRCQSVDLVVPADADLVLEGYLSGDWSHVEGPYGEYHGSAGPPHRNPLFKLTAITHRPDAVFQSATIGNPRIQHTDTAMIAALKGELMVWSALERAIARPLDVYCPPAAGGRHHVRIRIQNRDPGDSRNALLAALSCQADVKLATVVDEDVDIRDDSAVEWAMSTRYQADRDTIIVDGLRTLPLEPSLDKTTPGGVVTSKLGIDATRRRDKPAAMFAASQAPATEGLPGETSAAMPNGNIESLCAALRDQLTEPRSYLDLVNALVGVHQRDLLTALGTLRGRGLLTMDDAGNYVPTHEDTN